MAVAYVTEKANVNTLSYVFSKLMAPSFQKTNVCLNHAHVEDVPAETNVLRLKKSGYMTASAQTESTAFALAANGELTDSYVDATAAAAAVVSALSEQAKRFGGADASPTRIMAEQGAAIARYVDNDFLSVIQAISQSVVATAGLTRADLILGQYAIFAGNVPDLNIPLSFIGHPKAFADLGIEAVQAGAAAYANDVLLGIFKDTGGKPAANGYRGEVAPGIGGYMTTGFSTGSGDNYQGLVHPKWGLAAIVDTGIIVKTVSKISEGFYDEIGSLYFYDALEYHAAANCLIRSNS